jgi:hypothetical protein
MSARSPAIQKPRPELLTVVVATNSSAYHRQLDDPEWMDRFDVEASYRWGLLGPASLAS